MTIKEVLELKRLFSANAIIIDDLNIKEDLEKIQDYLDIILIDQMLEPGFNIYKDLENEYINLINKVIKIIND